MGAQERERSRNYVGINGHEVYYRIPLRQGAYSKRKGHPGCGSEGWTCCLCARAEYNCVCERKDEQL